MKNYNMSQKDRATMNKLKGSSFSSWAGIQNDKLLKTPAAAQAKALRSQKRVEIVKKGITAIESAGKALGRLGAAAFKAGQENRARRLGLNTPKVSNSAALREEVKILELEKRRAKLLKEKEEYKGYY